MTPPRHEEIQRIVSERGAALVLYARQWCSWPDDALQEALYDLIQLQEMPRDATAWMFNAVRFKAINLARSEKRRTDRERKAALQRDIWFVASEDNGDRIQELERELALLPPLEREIVVARVWGALTFGQIAELTNKPLSTVHRHYLAALSKLKRRLDRRDGELCDNDGLNNAQPLKLNEFH